MKRWNVYYYGGLLGFVIAKNADKAAQEALKRYPEYAGLMSVVLQEKGA